MKQLTFQEYKDKVKACWLGKNIGGTLGAPFECYRGVYDLTYYTHDLSRGVLPNDDLDLQLVWLNAAEKYGKNVNADILGEYWISYIVADWSEYGAGKNNLRYGLRPPISGWYKNHNKDSCGCFIRSEIWACLAPGHPEIAVKYAYEDAICDHAEEGMYGEIFCAALQSAAFVESDREKLIEAALSYIPADCAIAQVAGVVRECYESGIDWKEARKIVLQKFPGSFGMLNGYKDQEPEADVPVGQLGYDAPSNIGIMMVGWYYGEGDFSKSICIAAGCCEDGDCTAGTLGAILGIIHGTSIIEEKWLQPIGDEIKTISIDTTKMCLNIPRTVTALTQRVINLMPVFMHGHISWNEEGEMVFAPAKTVADKGVRKGVFEWEPFAEKISVSPVCVRKSSCLFDIQVEYEGDMGIQTGTAKRFHVKIVNQLHSQQWLECKLHLPEECGQHWAYGYRQNLLQERNQHWYQECKQYLPQEWTAQPCSSFCVNLNQRHGGCSVTEFDFVITPGAIRQGRYDILLEVKSNGRLNKMFVELPLLAEGHSPETI